jgi:acyl carrier protein
MSDTIESVLRRVIAKQVNVDESEVRPESTLEELGVGSLDLVEIIMSIEDGYGVEVPLDANAAAKSIKTVGDIIALGESLGVGKA